MLKDYQPQHIYHDYISELSLPSFDFIVHYAEQLTQDVVVFSHTSNLYALYYGLEGATEFQCGDQVIRMEPDTAVLLSKNLRHSTVYHPQSPASYFVLLFDIRPKSVQPSITAGQEYEEIADTLARIDRDKFVHIVCSNSQRSTIAHIQEEIERHQIGWNSIVGLMFYRLFVKVLRDFAPQRSHVNTPSGYQNIALVVSKYIHANYMDKITIDMVAERLNVTPRHINRLFQSLFGASFAHTVNIIRAEYAKQYLLSTSESIETIATRVGLPSGKVMNKLFKEQEGMSPAAYRAANQKPN